MKKASTKQGSLKKRHKQPEISENSEKKIPLEYDFTLSGIKEAIRKLQKIEGEIRSKRESTLSSRYQDWDYENNGPSEESSQGYWFPRR